MATVLELITEALITVKALAVGETPGPDMTTDALNKFNEVIEGLSLQNLAVFGTTETTFNLVPGQAIYTIGPTGTIVTPRPPFLETGYVTLQGADFPVDLTITSEQYAAIGVKESQGVPMWAVYEPSYPNGTITLWPVPYLASTMTILSNTALTTATSLTDVFAMPPGYRKTIRLLLAWELASDYPGMTEGELQKLASDAKEALSLIKRNARKPQLMVSETAFLGTNRSSFGSWRNGV